MSAVSRVQALTELGHATALANDAEQALATLAARSKSFDMVFSDVVMPGMDGVALGNEIRRRYPGLPVLLTSGYSSVLAEEGPWVFRRCTSRIRSRSSRTPSLPRSANAGEVSAEPDAAAAVRS